MARPLRFGEANKRNNKKVRKNNKGRDLRLESLETRALLSVSPAAPISDAAEAVYAAPAELAAPEVDLALLEQTTVNNNDAQAADASLQSLAGYEVDNTYIIVVDVANAADDTDATTTLNEAITEANSLTTSYDTITIGFASGVETHTLNADLTAVTSSIIIDGYNIYDASGSMSGNRTSYVTIDGSSLYSGLNFASGSVSELDYVEVTGATTGLINKGSLTIGNASFSDNHGGYGKNKDGGGIYNEGTITVTHNLEVSNNSAQYGGGIANYGGTFTNSSGATMTVENNTSARNGAGIYNEAQFTNSGTLTLTGNQITGSSTYDGGGIYNKGDDTFGTFTNTGTLTLNDNRAVSNGGGIYNGGVFDSSATNSWIVIDGNTDADNVKTNANHGGGIYNDSNATFTVGGALDVQNNKATGNGGGIYNKGKLTATNVAINYNSATDGGGIYNASKNLALDGAYIIGNSASRYGGGLENTADLSNSTLTNLYFISNTAGDAGGGIDNTGNITMADNLVIASNSAKFGGGIYNNSGTFILNGDTEISENVASVYEDVNGAQGGGIYNGTKGTFKSNGALTVAYNIAMGVNDQTRGGGVYNAGTMDLGSAGKTVTMTGNTATVDGGGIYNMGTLTTSGNVTIDGDNSDDVTVISAMYGGGIFNSGTLTNTGELTVQNNVTTNGGAGVYNSDGTFTNASGASMTVDNNESGSYGGGIDNNGTLQLDGATTVSDNTAEAGGGIRNYGTIKGDGSLTVADNHATYGSNAGYNHGGGIYNQGDITFSNLTVSGNESNNDGGGVYNAGTMKLTGSKSDDGKDTIQIADNTAATYGGGIRNTGTLTVGGFATISGNEAREGGGINNSGSGTLTLTGKEEGAIKISENKSLKTAQDSVEEGGGGLNNTSSKDNVLTNVTFTGNTTEGVGGGIYNSGKLTTGGNVTIDGGNSDGTEIANAILGGGIYNEGTLTNTGDLTVKYANAYAGAGVGNFGGTFTNDSGATMTVDHNTATGEKAEAGGIGNNGNFTNNGTLNVTNNTATVDGGGIDNAYGTFTNNSELTVSGNSAKRGAGVINFGGTFTNSSDATMTVEKNTATGKGGGIFNLGSFSNDGALTVSDNKAANGAGIYNDARTFTNNGELTVKENESTNGGAGVYNNAGTFTNASDATMTVDKNTSGGYGGGIHNYVGTFTTLGTLNVTNNTAKGGAGIFNQGQGSAGKSVLFTNVDADGNHGSVTISGNTAQYGGGIMQVNQKAKVVLTGSDDKAVTISNNTATGLLTNNNDVYGSGAGIYNMYGDNSIELTNVTVSNNKATASGSRGGGIYNGGKLTATDVTISGNAATDGAGIYNTSQNLTLDGATFENNAATGNGGGLYNSADLSSQTLKDLTFTSNSAKNGGGLYNEENAKMTLENATFKSNEASQTGSSVEGRGGAIYNSGTIQSTGLLTATLNKAFGTNSKGGSIYNAKGASISIERASITDSSGLYGGSIYNAGNITNSDAVTISDSNQEKAQFGGGIYNDDTGVITAKGSLEVTKISSSSFGGGIYNKGIITATGGLTVSYNNAKNNGAGVYNSGTLKNFDEEGNKGSVSILGNKSQQSGGGIYNEGTLDLEADENGNNVTISSNTYAVAGGGIYNANTLTLKNVQITENTYTANKSKGGGIYNSGSVTAENLTLTGNTAQHDGGGITNDVGGTFTSSGTLEAGENHADWYGGAIYNRGTFEVEGQASIDSNYTRYGGGGGIANDIGGDFIVASTGTLDVTNNSSYQGGGFASNGDATLTNYGAIAFKDNTAFCGGGMMMTSGNLVMDESSTATLTFEGNDTTSGQVGYGAGLYIVNYDNAQATRNGKTFYLTDADNGKIKFIDNGHYSSERDVTYGGAIYNGGVNELIIDGYAFGVDVTTDEDTGKVTLAKNDELNHGVGAAICNVGILSNTYSYDDFYAGSAEAKDEADNYLSEKKFSLYVANQDGSAIAVGTYDGSNAGKATLSNVKIFGNQGGIYVYGNGDLTLEKGSEIGADQFTTGNGGTSGYKYYDDDAFTGNTEFGVKVTNGKFTVKQAEATAKYLNQYKDDAQTVRYDDYQVLDSTRISGNGTGLIVSGGEAYLNDVRMEGNENGAVISRGTVKTANTLIDSKVTVSGGEATFTSTTIVNGNESALENNGGTVNLVNSIAVAASGVINDNSGKGTEEYSAYNFQRDVLGNLYTLGGGSVAANAGVNEDAQYTDGTAIANDLAGHDRVLYGTVDLGAFENPVYWIMGDDSLEDIKMAVESVATIDFGGAVKFDISANGKTFEWEDQANANWIHIYQDVNIDARYLGEDGNYYWMDVTLDGTNTSGTGLFRVVKNGVTANLFSLDVENAASNNRLYPAGALNVLTASAVNLYGVSFENCSGQNGGAIYGGKDAVVNIVSTTADGYVNDKGETELVDDLYKLSVFEGNSGVYGGAVRVNNTSASNTVGGVEYGNGLNITGVDLDSVSYMDGEDWTGTKSGVAYDETTGAVKQYSVQFIGNTASEKGGAVYVGGTASIDGASFVDNSVPGTTTSGLYGGGAMFVAGKLDIANADFLDNHSTVSGGAVVVTGQTTGNGNLVFAGNSVDYNPEAVGASAENGGAIYVYDGAKLTLNGVKETEADDATADSATETTGVKTRAIYEGSLSTSGKANEFLGNEAYLGGAVMNRNGSVEISDARFAANLAVDGAGVYNFGTGKVAFNDGVEFESNLAYARAGGVFNAGATSQVTGDATFTNNYASNAGAAWNVEADGDNYAYGSYNPVYDNSNLGDKREATAVSVEGDMSAFGKAAVKSTTLPTLTITAATTTTGLQSTTNVSEWSALNAEIKTDAYAVSKDGSLTQEIVYDATKFAANLDSLQAASGWSVEATETLTDDGMTALQLTFTAEKDQIIENETIGSLSFSTVDRLTEDSELLGVVVERMGYDMNADDSVDLSDLVMFAGKFGTTDSAADFNSDGKVDITDLVKFARHYGVKRETVALASTQAAPQAKTEAVIEAAPKVETEVATVLPETATEATLETVDAKVNATVVPESAPVATTVQDLVFSMDDEDEEDWLEAICSAQENEKDAIDSLFDF